MAIIYTLSLPTLVPSFQSRIHFLAPSHISVLKLNEILHSKETQQTLYHRFLTKAMSTKFQSEIFSNNKYSAKLSPNYEPGGNLQVNGTAFISTILTLDSEKIAKGKLASYEIPWNISMTGSNPVVISSFLNDLVKSADKAVIKQLVLVYQQKIAARLNKITNEKLNLIEKNKQKLSNNIRLLTDSLEIAKKNGIKNNNFEVLGNEGVSSSAKLVLGNYQEIPTWYLYGEDALKTEISNLKNRENDFIYNIEYIELDKEEMHLKSIVLNLTGISTIQIDQLAIPSLESMPEQGRKRSTILIFQIIAGFMLSIFLVYIKKILKSNN